MRDIMLMVHFIGIAMFIGTGFAFTVLEIANAKLEKAEHQKFSLRILPLSKIGHIGLLLLIMSGEYLMTPYWGSLKHMPYMMGKLTLVIIVIVLISFMAVYSRKARKGDTEKYLKKIEPFSKATFVVGFAIVILAVLTFH